jgi:hypothetical protein
VLLDHICSYSWRLVLRCRFKLYLKILHYTMRYLKIFSESHEISFGLDYEVFYLIFDSLVHLQDLQHLQRFIPVDLKAHYSCSWSQGNLFYSWQGWKFHFRINLPLRFQYPWLEDFYYCSCHSVCLLCKLEPYSISRV